MRSHRLVIADSQLLFAQALAEALRANGHEVLGVCVTRRELAAALRPEGVTACLSDLQLADGNVHDLLADVAASKPECHIVVVTDDARPDVLQSVLEVGASGYVQKSRGLDLLLDALTRVGRGEVVVEASFMPTTSARLADSTRARALRASLTNREQQCLRLIVEGKDTSAICKELLVSRTTVRSHVQALLSKLNVHSRLEAAALAIHLGLVPGAAGEAGNGPESSPLRSLRGGNS
jgi:two-component system nitrate/nitrite response regulator NarL